MPYVNERWLGGLLTNFVTVRKSLDRAQGAGDDGGRRPAERLTKKELAALDKERIKLERNLHGIKGMKTLPDAVFVIDTRKEPIAVQEARKLKIPVVGVVDTNCDPDEVDYVIPGNDDALRAIRLFAGRIADAVIAGRGLREARAAEAAARQGRPATSRRRRREVRRGRSRARPPSDRTDGLTVRGRRDPRRPLAPAPQLRAAGRLPGSRASSEDRGSMSISAEMVRKLREETGAGMMDCKSALVEAKGDAGEGARHPAQEGAGRRRQEGRPRRHRGRGRPLHPPRRRRSACWSRSTARPTSWPRRRTSRAWCATSPCTSRRCRAALRDQGRGPGRRCWRRRRRSTAPRPRPQGKPAAVQDKIAEGKLKDYYATFCLLEQPFVQDPKLTVGQLVQEKIAIIKENIVVRRFARFKVGEDVAAGPAAKPTRLPSRSSSASSRLAASAAARPIREESDLRHARRQEGPRLQARSC